MKITLLGDSIRMLGYGNMVPQLLGEEFEVYQPNDNHRFSKFTLRGLFDWEESMRGSRSVHWNNGLWDVTNLFGDGLFTPEEEYVENMLRIANVLTKRYDKVIFATTTPVKEAYPHSNTADIKRYNAIIVPLLEKKGIIINDLHSLVAKDVENYITDDNIHLSEEGTKVCAEQVAKVICEVAKTLK